MVRAIKIPLLHQVEIHSQFLNICLSTKKGDGGDISICLIL